MVEVSKADVALAKKLLKNRTLRGVKMAGDSVYIIFEDKIKDAGGVLFGYSAPEIERLKNRNGKWDRPIGVLVNCQMTASRLVKHLDHDTARALLKEALEVLQASVEQNRVKLVD